VVVKTAMNWLNKVFESNNCEISDTCVHRDIIDDDNNDDIDNDDDDDDDDNLIILTLCSNM